MQPFDGVFIDLVIHSSRQFPYLLQTQKDKAVLLWGKLQPALHTLNAQKGWEFCKWSQKPKKGFERYNILGCCNF